MASYRDKKGYKRGGYKKHSDLVHRQVAYHQIYLKNKHKYPLRFSEYVVHHKDENKRNNHVNNLQIMTKEEHDKIHAWLIKKGKSNFGDFSLIRLITGDRFTEILKAVVKWSFILTIAVSILDIFINGNYSPIGENIAIFFLIIFVISFAIMCILGIAGFVWGHIMNTVYSIKKAFRNK